MRAYKYLLLGESGSGKTFSASTLADCPGIEKVCYVFTEPGQATLFADNFPRKELLGKKIHVLTVRDVSPTIAEMAENAETLIEESRTKQRTKQSVGSKELRLGFTRFLRNLDNYVCDITGEELGAVDNWPPSWVLIIDSLSGLNSLCMRHTVGMKTTKTQEDWGDAMGMEEEMLDTLTRGLSCTVVLTAHITRERDEVAGTTTLTVDALGSKLGPRVPRNFDEVIMCKDTGEAWIWSTQERNMTLKSRRLPRQSKLPPTFTQIYRGVD